MKRIIVAINKLNGIGIDNKLAWHNPEDLKWFKHITQNMNVIMGRKTFESLGRPLPNRNNIVVSSTMKNLNGIIICKTLDDAFEQFPECWVIGGAQIYEQAILKVDEMFITHVDNYNECDTFFPNISDEWSSEIVREFSGGVVIKYQRSL